MIATLATKMIPTPTTRWEPARFDANEFDESDFETDDEEDLDFYASEQPDYTLLDVPYDVDPEVRRVTVNGDTVTPRAVPVFDVDANPVENLETRLPMPAVPSPARTADVAESGFTMVNPDAPTLDCCTEGIPSFDLRQVRENLGGNMADRARWGTGPGEGIALPEHGAFPGTEQTQHGPVPVSDPAFTPELYQQGFISLSAVPSVYVGEYTDPITGEVFDAYESALPPPDADYEETLTAPGRNVKLAHLQGGWRDTTPRPTKTEVVEDDFHMQYDRSIRTYGTYDPTYYVEIIEQNNRFSRDGHHPDADGAILVGTPANTLGNQGDVRVRPMPYVTPTNRGKWGETTFRSGIDPVVAVGGGDQRPEYEYTKFPYMRAENSRMDGGGMQVTTDTTGFMLQYGGSDGFDVLPTQRSTTEQRAPHMGPAAPDAFGQQVYGAVAPSNRVGGTMDVGMYGVGNVSGSQNNAQGAKLQNQIVATPHSLAGLEATDISNFGPTHLQYGTGQKLMNRATEANTTTKSGVLNEHITWGATGDTAHATQLDGGVRTAMDKTKREALLTVQAAFDTALGHNNAAQTVADRTRFNDKKGPLVDFLMPSSAVGGLYSTVSNGVQLRGESTNLDTKRESWYNNQFGAHVAAQPSDGTIVYGEYTQQKVEYRDPRSLGSVVNHPFASASEALGFRTDDTVGR